MLFKVKIIETYTYVELFNKVQYRFFVNDIVDVFGTHGTNFIVYKRSHISFALIPTCICVPV